MNAHVEPPGSAPKRVLIAHQGCVPIYRAALFERLAGRGAIAYTVAYGRPPRGTDYITAPEPYAFDSLKIENREAKLAGKSLIWQPLVRPFIRRFDAAVLGEEVKYISHLGIILAAKALGRPVILWGYGYPSKAETARSQKGMRRVLNGLALWYRQQLLKSIDGYLVYTDAGRDALLAEGFPAERIGVVHNTVDITTLQAWRAKAEAEPEAARRAALDLPAKGPVLVYFGRYLPDKRIDLLLSYVASRQAERPDLTLLVFGDGAERERLAAAAVGLSVQLRRPDDVALTRALTLADAVVIPGHLGLAVTHAFAFARPVITRAGIHPPEFSYLRDGENGLVLPTDATGFHAGLDRFLDDAALQATLREGAARAAETLSMDRMAQAFDTLVRTTLQARK